MRKLISLGGSTALIPGGVHDYRRCREDVLATGTTWVKIWVSWQDVQEPFGRPESLAESWNQLNGGLAGGELGLKVIDEQVRAANEDGVAVVLCIQTSYPSWSQIPPGRDRPSPPPPYTASEQLPYDAGPESPYGWFVAHLCARYRRGVGANPFGPRPSSDVAPAASWRCGNPQGAHVRAIEVCNEPNLQPWPQHEAPARAAQMMRTGAHWSAELGGPPIFGPATSDTEGGFRGTHYLDFTNAVLAELRGWRPRAHVAWSLHNVKDTEEGTVARLAAVRGALERAGWAGRTLWLTEGGYDTTPRGTDQLAPSEAAQVRQAELITDAWAKAQEFSASAEREGRMGRLHTFGQHVVHDQDHPTNVYKSGLRDDFTTEPGRRRPAWFAWRDLPGAPTP